MQKPRAVSQLLSESLSSCSTQKILRTTEEAEEESLKWSPSTIGNKKDLALDLPKGRVKVKIYVGHAIYTHGIACGGSRARD